MELTSHCLSSIKEGASKSRRQFAENTPRTIQDPQSQELRKTHWQGIVPENNTNGKPQNRQRKKKPGDNKAIIAIHQWISIKELQINQLIQHHSLTLLF